MNLQSIALLAGLVLGLGLPCAARADLPAVIDKVKPAVVIVGSYKASNSPRFRLRGTGFVVADGNLAVTNAHVLPDSSEDFSDSSMVLQVRGAANALQMRTATVLALDKEHDLALLRFDGPSVPALKLGDSGAVREGQAVAFMGFPIGGALGFSAVTHRGLISSITAAALPTPTAQQLNAKAIRSLRAGPFDIFQLDATAYPGNSGGPLFDTEKGEVLGVINMVFIKGTKESALTHPSGISYAIPSRHIVELLQREGIK
jgi:S1-C subfamily serine protease